MRLQHGARRVIDARLLAALAVVVAPLVRACDPPGFVFVNDAWNLAPL
jgi:hypothetical protein